MAPEKHRHQSCRDRDCQRPYCRIWREARAEGYRDGYDDGERAGFAAGFAAGVSAAGGD